NRRSCPAPLQSQTSRSRARACRTFETAIRRTLSRQALQPRSPAGREAAVSEPARLQRPRSLSARPVKGFAAASSISAQGGAIVKAGIELMRRAHQFGAADVRKRLEQRSGVGFLGVD